MIDTLIRKHGTVAVVVLYAARVPSGVAQTVAK
jgi:hypothetical protein